MKKSTIILFSTVIVLLVVVTGVLYSIIRNQQTEMDILSQRLDNESTTASSTLAQDNDTIAKLNSQLSNQSTQNNFALESQCAQNAKNFFGEGTYQYSDFSNNSTYTSHYNESLNKCFISISINGTTGNGTSVYGEDLYDATQGTMYGSVLVPFNSSTGVLSTNSVIACLMASNPSIIQCSSLGQFINFENKYINTGGSK